MSKLCWFLLWTVPTPPIPTPGPIHPPTQPLLGDVLISWPFIFHACTIFLIYLVSMETWVAFLKLWLPHFLLKSSKTKITFCSLSIHASWFWPKIHSSFHSLLPGMLCSRRASLCSVSKKHLSFLIMVPSAMGRPLGKSCGSSNVTFRGVTWPPGWKENLFLSHYGAHVSATCFIQFRSPRQWPASERLSSSKTALSLSLFPYPM